MCILILLLLDFLVFIVCIGYVLIIFICFVFNLFVYFECRYQVIVTHGWRYGKTVQNMSFILLIYIIIINIKNINLLLNIYYVITC